MTQPFVSRAGEKLEFALQQFHINVQDTICADFGSSTGGFVDCLLRHGAKKVYAIDTAYGELAWKLRQHPKVIVMEKTNAMHVLLFEKMDIITNDTSWTKQKNIIPNMLANLKDNGSIITLIKPHYEADKKLLQKGVLPKTVSEEVAKAVLKQIQSMGITVKDFITSPLIGSKGGNSEYLAYLKKSLQYIQSHRI
jgi:23S rRNA (cytidine1920-2'-O)/16S rRNA (cytidine1409-2'-O)-methyltransferase